MVSASPMWPEARPRRPIRSHQLMGQTIKSALVHGIMSKEEAEKDARELFAALQLPDPDNIGFRYPRQVSGGQL